MKLTYTLQNLPKGLEPYRNLIEDVWDWRKTGEGLRIILKRGYTWEQCHAIINDTVKACIDDFYFVKSGCKCEDCTLINGRCKNEIYQ